MIHLDYFCLPWPPQAVRCLFFFHQAIRNRSPRKGFHQVDFD